jgi:uncharacterized protein YceK
MKAFRKLLLFSMLLSATGCGTAYHLSQMNGEYYLGSHVDCQAISVTFNHSQYAMFVPGSIVTAIPWLICWGVDLPVSLLTDTLLIPFDYAQGRKKGLNIAVVDDEGNPVSGALIRGLGIKGVNGKTNNRGLYRWASDPLDVEYVEVSKPKHYSTTLSPRGRQAGGLSSSLKAGNSNTVYILLERTVNPIPMIAKSFEINWTKMPSTNQWYGFDVEKGDWVQPLGGGSSSDLLFRVDGIWKDYRNYDLNLSLGFSKGTDGVAFVPPVIGGIRPTPREAPTNGYVPVITWHKSSKQGGQYYCDDTVKNECEKSPPFMIRIRSATNSEGVVANAYYGKIRNIDFSIPFQSRAQERGVSLKFVYYVNPTPNDRNLEFDPKTNLLHKYIMSTEEPRGH